MRNRILTASVALLLTACASSDKPEPTAQKEVAEAAPEKKEPSPPVGKLPESVTPVAYRLKLEIDPAKERFGGEVEIDVKLAEATDLIWLHGQNMTAEGAVLVMGAEEKKATFAQKTETGVAAFQLEEKVGPGDATLRIQYAAPYDTKLKGLYRVVESGEPYVFTQFESHFARLCFPSFDEPRFKTPFDITVTARETDKVITTTGEVGNEDLGDGRVKHTFETTRPLPTYLIAFAVGALDVVEHEGGIPANSVRKEPLPFRGVAAKGKGDKLKHALENTGEILTALEEYFGMPYPFGKLDVIAVPDFSSGAMENVGAVTFREWLLLMGDKAPIGQKQAFTAVMAHELAHMWFGNIVTMPWWDDIWLNEAFATWMASKIVHQLEPEWNADLNFVSRVQSAMGYDALTSARQIRQPIKSDDDIRNAFDAITYSKGGGVLSMFERWLGKDVFQKGLQAYMRKHEYGSATYEDLLAALSEASGKDVATPFKTFLFQPGVPLVDTTLSCEGAPKLTFKQSRYLPLGSPGDAKATWKVPLCVSFPDGKKNKEQCTLIDGETSELPLETKSCPAWVLPNAGAAGYVRFVLPDDMWAKVPLDKLTPAERTAFADSLSAASSAGRIKAAAFLAAMPAIAKDKTRSVAQLPMTWVGSMADHTVSEPVRPRALAWGKKIYAPLLKRLGMSARKKDDADTRKLRAELLSFLVQRVGDDRTTKAMAKLGNKALDGKDIDPDLKPVALVAAVRVGDEKTFDKALKKMKKSTDALERGLLLAALSSTTDEKLSARALDLVLDPDLKGNETLNPLWTQLGQPETRDAAWAFFTSKYIEIMKVVPTTRQGNIPWLASFYCKASKADETEAFFKDRIGDIVGGPRNLKGAVEAIRLCAERASFHRESAEKFFAENAPKVAAR